MFTENLELDLTLTIGGTAHHVVGGNVTGVRASLESWGFEAEVTFWTAPRYAADDVLVDFVKTDLCRVKLEVKGGEGDGHLNDQEVERLQVVWPAPVRHGVRVLNSATESASTTLIPNDDAVTGVNHDFLRRTPIATELTELGALEALRLKAGK